jgi:hypothetical protein
MTSDSALRVMRSNALRALVAAAFLAGLASGTLLRAQEQTGEPAATPPPAADQGAAKPDTGNDPAEPPPAFPDDDSAKTPAPPAPAQDGGSEAPQKETADDDVDLPKPPGEAPKGSSPSRFEPTEKVRADFDVSFPVDI